MKHLQDYIIEQAEISIEESISSKSITFNFNDLENADETLESLKDNENVEINDKKLTLSITQDNVDKIDTIQDILQQYCDTIRNSSKRSENELYAQKTIKFEECVKIMNDTIDEIKASKEEDKKEED